MLNNAIRLAEREDLNGLQQVLDSSELFPSEFLEDMISDYFKHPDSSDIWFTYLEYDVPVALGYCAPEKLTNGTFNLYAIAVRREKQGQGIGEKMMAFIEKLLHEKGGRVLIVETSSAEQYTVTRRFYNKLGYHQEAVIRDFWNDGEDKVIFWKKLHELA